MSNFSRDFNDRVSTDVNFFVRGKNKFEVVETTGSTATLGFTHMIRINMKTGPAAATLFLTQEAFDNLYQEMTSVILAAQAERIGSA